MNDAWVLDAGMPGPPWAFCPVERDDKGNVTNVVVGLTLVGSLPEGERLIGVVHPDGQEAVEAWCAEHPDVMAEFFASPA